METARASEAHRAMQYADPLSYVLTVPRGHVTTRSAAWERTASTSEAVLGGDDKHGPCVQGCVGAGPS